MAQTTIFPHATIVAEWRYVSRTIGPMDESQRDRMKTAFPKYLWYCAMSGGGSAIRVLEMLGGKIDAENFLAFAEGIDPR